MKNKRELAVRFLVVLIFVIIISFGVIVFFLLQRGDTENVSIYDPIESTTLKENEVFTIYLLDLVEKYASKAVIFKSLDGDITSPKLTELEAKSSRDEYVLKLENVISDTEIVVSTYVTDNKKYLVYNFEKVLNKLGLSSNNGAGILQDSEGLKTYFLGEKVKDSTEF